MKRLAEFFQSSRVAFACGLLLAAGCAQAAVSFAPFDSNSLATLQARHPGRAQVLVFWSASCAPCVEDLPHWAQRQRRFPGIDIHLVNLDAASERGSAEKLLRQSPAARLSHWAIADPVPERVYWAVDRNWHGETPYHRFIDRQGKASAFTGRIDADWLQAWLADNAARPAPQTRKRRE